MMRMCFFAVVVFLVSLIYSPELWAATEQVEVPWAQVLAQVLNVTLFILLVGFLIRKKIAAHFTGRYNSYNDLVTRAEQAKAEAQRIKADVQQRLERLEQTAQESVTAARTQAEEMRKQLEAEAQQLGDHLKKEAQKTAYFEVERAKAELRQELLEISIRSAEQVLKEQVGDPEQKRLQDEFVSKIQVVS